MADLETGIKDALLGDATITGIVGTRVRPLGVSPDDVRPYLTYQVTGGDGNLSIDGAPADYLNAEFEIGVYSPTYTGAMDLSKAVRNRLDGFGETVSDVEFAPSMFDGQTDVEESGDDGTEDLIYVRVITFKVLYKLTN